MTAARKKRRPRTAEEAEAYARAVDEAVVGLRQLLETHPLLLLHDPSLPSVTTALAGAPIAGSWWAHPRGGLVWEVVQRIEGEVAWPKLVRGAVTLVHRSLWPALIAVGRSEEPWQLHGMAPEARALFARINEAGSARTDHLRETGDGRVVGRAVEQLERRLLVVGTQVHTPEGKHARELTTWRRWQQHVGLGGVALPPAPDARATLEAAVAGWSQAGGPLLPWSG